MNVNPARTEVDERGHSLVLRERDMLRAALTASVPMSHEAPMDIERAMAWAAGLRLIDAHMLSHRAMIVLADEVERLRRRP